MLDDFYMEYMIRKKKNGGQIAILAAVIGGAVLLSCALALVMFAVAFALAGSSFTSFVFSIGLVLIAFMWYGAYLLISMQNIEYEYILTNSEMDIDKVMSKKGRKNVVSFDFKNVTICAAADDLQHKAEYNKHIDRTYDAVGDYSRGGVYFADYTDGSESIRVLFQPTLKMIKAAWKYNPRNIFVNE